MREAEGSSSLNLCVATSRMPSTCLSGVSLITRVLSVLLLLVKALGDTAAKGQVFKRVVRER